MQTTHYSICFSSLYDLNADLKSNLQVFSHYPKSPASTGSCQAQLNRHSRTRQTRGAGLELALPGDVGSHPATWDGETLISGGRVWCPEGQATDKGVVCRATSIGKPHQGGPKWRCPKRRQSRATGDQEGVVGSIWQSRQALSIRKDCLPTQVLCLGAKTQM